MHQFSTSLKTLQEKINVIKALKAPPMDSENLKINIAGTEKRLVLNINKLHEAIYFEPIPSEDNKKDPEPIPKVKKLDFYIPPNDHKYLSQTLQGFKVTEVKEGLIQKHSMVQMLKFIGDFAKLKNEQNSKEAQIARLEHYGKDDDLYIETIKNTLKTEEENYNYCTKSILFKLKVEHDVFVKSEQALLSDPFAQFELMKNSFDETTSDVEIPELLDKETSIDIIKKANDMAFSKFKQLFRNGLKVDPSMIPVLITCLSHDYIFDVFGYSEEVFKAVIQHYKIFDDPDLSIYIQNKQIELMKLK